MLQKLFEWGDSVLRRNISKHRSLKLLSPLGFWGTIAVSAYPACAQVTPDNTLGAEQSIVTSSMSNSTLRQQIEGGAIRGINLFHSFRDFNIAAGQSLYFQNPIGIQNIISRVTSGSPSNIEGTLGVSGGTANLFLLNPNGILFGANARLDVRGSFVATTATALQFGTQGFFSSSAPTSPPLLTVNPSAFWFNQVTFAAIVDHSTTPLESGRQGLQVPDGQSLLLLGGDVNLEGGGVNAAEGRVELGAVASTGAVGLSLDDNNNLRLSFPVTLDRADISLTNGATVNTSGEGSGPIQIWGRRVSINGGAQVAAFTQGAKSGGSLTVNASESLKLMGLAPFGNISTLSFGDGKAGNITIETQNLSVQGGATIFAGTLGNGSGGQLSVNASESVEVAGLDTAGDSSSLASFTGGAGQAGNLTINTKRLIVRDGAALSTEALFDQDANKRVVIPLTGEGGNLTINASASVEVINGYIATDTSSPGNAGNLTINTGRLLVQNGSLISAQSQGSGNAGNIVVQARSIELKNQSQILATTTASQGGNIALQAQNFLLLRQGSSISTTAGTDRAGGNGGNISIDGNLIVAVLQENSDITANAFSGRGGNITITTQGLFGIEPHSTATPLSNITASSQFGISGTITLNTPDVDPSRGTVALPAGLVDINALIANSCVARRSHQGRFVITGTGGLVAQPDDLANAAFPTYELVPDPLKAENAPPSRSTSITEPDRIYRLTTGEVVLGRSCH